MGIFDYPTSRKNHLKPTPLIFSLLFSKNLIIYLYYSDLSNQSILLTILLSLFVMFGALDDKRNISYYSNLFFTSILILLTLEMFPDLIINKINFFYFKVFAIDHIGIFLTLLALSFILIISNWFDGHNTFSSFYLLSLLLFFIFKIDFNSEIHFLITILFISLIIFLPFNYFGKVFMGSGGVYPLSFLCGILFLNLNNQNQLYFEEILSLCLIPIIDFYIVIFKRIKKNKSIFLPDNHNHYHQVLKVYPYNSRVIIIFFHTLLSFLGAYIIELNLILISLNISLFLINYYIIYKFYKKI